MPTLITCPGCTHKLTLPEDVVGQRARCPRCGLDFDAHPMASPALDVAPPPDAAPKSPPAQTAYTDKATARSSAGVIFCILCGTKVAPNDPACPACGYRIHELFDEPRRDSFAATRRTIVRPRGFLPVVGAILIPVGLVNFAVSLIVTEGFRRPGGPGQVFGIVFLVLADLLELTAFLFFITWLYQAWRAVQGDDEDYPPGLMVGLLFVPCFNFYWMFRAIPGLSSTVHQELRYVAPNRVYGSGWEIGLLACILAFLPPLWPIAICLFIAWVLIVNNAIHRLARLHDALPRERPSDDWTEA